MVFLAVASGLYTIHDDVFGGHEGKLGHKALGNYLVIYHQAVCYVDAKIQDAVSGQKTLCNGKSLVGTVIKGTLKPLGG